MELVEFQLIVLRNCVHELSQSKKGETFSKRIFSFPTKKGRGVKAKPCTLQSISLQLKLKLAGISGF